MSGYTKLFNSIVTSTIWEKDSDTKVVWITMLALSDADGYVEASIPGLARVAGVTIEAAKKALEILKSPDEYSRTPDNEGRRIEDREGGWMILNRAKYRDKDWQEEKAIRHRESNRRYYEQKKANSDNSNPKVSESDGVGDKKEKEKEKEKGSTHAKEFNSQECALQIRDYYGFLGNPYFIRDLADCLDKIVEVEGGSVESARDNFCSRWDKAKDEGAKSIKFWIADGKYLHPASPKPQAWREVQQ